MFTILKKYLNDVLEETWEFSEFYNLLIVFSQKIQELNRLMYRAPGDT
jgi:hypothetical protein